MEKQNKTMFVNCVNRTTMGISRKGIYVVKANHFGLRKTNYIRK